MSTRFRNTLAVFVLTGSLALAGCGASKAAGDPSLKGSGGCGLEEAAQGVGSGGGHVVVASHYSAGQGSGGRTYCDR